MLRTTIAGPDFGKLMAGAEAEVAGFVTAAMADTVDDVREAFRAEIRAAGLGDRLARAIRNNIYPKGRDSLDPAGWVYAPPSKDGRGAAAIIDSYANGRMITPRAGRRWLAIPTDDTPRARQGNAMTPEQVEARYGRRLIFIDPADKGFRTPTSHKPGVAYLVMKDLVIRKASQKYRNATARELAGNTRNPRQVQMVIMFVLVRAVRKPKSIDMSVPAALAGTRFAANLADRWR